MQPASQWGLGRAIYNIKRSSRNINLSTSYVHGAYSGEKGSVLQIGQAGLYFWSDLREKFDFTGEWELQRGVEEEGKSLSSSFRVLFPIFFLLFLFLFLYWPTNTGIQPYPILSYPRLQDNRATQLNVLQLPFNIFSGNNWSLFS